MGRTYSYETTWEQIETMLDKAEREANRHLSALNATDDRHQKVYHMRNYKALQGVITALRWTLGDVSISENKLLGRD